MERVVEKRGVRSLAVWDENRMADIRWILSIIRRRNRIRGGHVEQNHIME